MFKNASKTLTGPNDKNRAEIQTRRLEEPRHTLITNKKRTEFDDGLPVPTFGDLVLINPLDKRTALAINEAPPELPAFSNLQGDPLLKSFPSSIFSTAKLKCCIIRGKKGKGAYISSFLAPVYREQPVLEVRVLYFREDAPLPARNQRRPE